MYQGLTCCNTRCKQLLSRSTAVATNKTSKSSCLWMGASLWHLDTRMPSSLSNQECQCHIFDSSGPHLSWLNSGDKKLRSVMQLSITLSKSCPCVECVLSWSLRPAYSKATAIKLQNHCVFLQNSTAVDTLCIMLPVLLCVTNGLRWQCWSKLNASRKHNPIIGQHFWTFH